VEINLAEYDRFVIAHTNKYAIYEFWWSMGSDPSRMYRAITSDRFKFHPKMYEIMQRRWVEFKDPIIRSSIFFTLNQMSNTGLISSGKLAAGPLNPVALGNLRAFKIPQNMHFVWDNCDDFLEPIGEKLMGEYCLVFAGKFNYNFFEHGKSQSYDTYSVDHRKLKELIEKTNKKTVLVYNYDKKVDRFYKNFKRTFIDKYGKITTKPAEAQEIIVANF